MRSRSPSPIACRPPACALFGLGQLDDLQFDPVFARGRGRFLACVALVDESDLDAVVGVGLHGFGQPPDLGANIGIGRRDMRGQEMAERAHRHVQRRALLAFGLVVVAPSAASANWG